MSILIVFWNLRKAATKKMSLEALKILYIKSLENTSTSPKKEVNVSEKNPVDFKFTFI